MVTPARSLLLAELSRFTPWSLSASDDGIAQWLTAFDLVVPIGASLQAAVDSCSDGALVLLSPGAHPGPLALPRNKEVHLFGMGRAAIESRAKGAYALESGAGESTVAGLAIRKLSGGEGDDGGGVAVRGGRLTLRGCDVTCEAKAAPCVRIEGGAETDPVVQDCK